MQNDAAADGRGGLGTVRNAVLLLELLSRGPAHQQLTDLAERSGLSVPTVHRLLRSLVLADLVEQDPRSSRYGLGPELTRLSHQYLARLPILGALAPYLVQLRDQVGSTVHVMVLVREQVVYIDQVDGDDRGMYRDAHRVHPALSTAGGRVLVSHADAEVWKRAWELASPQDQQEADRGRDTWAHAGYLVADGPDPTTPREVAVPVMDGHGLVVAALAANVPASADAAQIEAMATHLRLAAAAAGRTLGHG
jgi:IclR family transcriptional regulator, acetate operon repressor